MTSAENLYFIYWHGDYIGIWGDNVGNTRIYNLVTCVVLYQTVPNGNTFITKNTKLCIINWVELCTRMFLPQPSYIDMYHFFYFFFYFLLSVLLNYLPTYELFSVEYEDPFYLSTSHWTTFVPWISIFK